MGLKLAVLYPRLSSYGGVERLLYSLAKNFDATIFTGFYNPSETFEGFKSLRIVEYGSVFGAGKLRNYEDALRSLLLELDDFDIIMPHMLPNTVVSLRYGAKTLWYCHAPLRAIYDLKPYFLKNFGCAGKFTFLAHHYLLEIIDKTAVTHIRKIVCNSYTTKRRIVKFYGRNAEVVYPGINLKAYRKEEFGDFLLCVSGLSRTTTEFYKRPQLAIQAMRYLKDKKLFIVGEGTERPKLMKQAPSNVIFLGNIKDKVLRKLYSKCLAVLYPAFNEDFGLVPIEAMASGKPVIACRDGGGVCETVLDGKTGFLTEPTPQHIAEAVEKLEEKEALETMSKNCLERASFFSEERFIKKMKEAFAKF